MATYETRGPDGTEIHVGEADLARFALGMGLDKIAPGRYSKLFVFKLLLYTQFQGVEADFIIEELKALEGLPNRAVNTKPATQFTRLPLKGLWHQHFFDARFVAQNLLTHMQSKEFKHELQRIFDPTKSKTITEKMIEELAHAASEGGLEERENQGKLTGEWIVFAKHRGQNYYLTLDIHTAGDQKIHDEISSMAYVEFPFLAAP